MGCRQRSSLRIMVEIKIACQCGVPFRYGLEVMNGRAPEGVTCPTCSAPVTPACNLLLDFLAGKNPAPPTTGTRVLKDIKVFCPCGARYKFELELGESIMPTSVACPACQASLTELANEELKNFPARFSTAPPGVQPKTTVVPPPVQTGAEAKVEVSGIPGVLPPSPAATPTPAPAAAPSTEGVPAPAPKASEPKPTPSAAAAMPALDFDGPPRPKGMPNLKPLELPRMERPVRAASPTVAKDGAKPAATATAASVPAATGQPKVESKSAAKAEPRVSAAPPARPPAVKSPAPPRALNFPLGIVGAIVGASLGAGAWVAVLTFTQSGGGWMALLVGVLAGLGARLLGRGRSQALGAVACSAALIAIGLMSWVAMVHHVNRLARPTLKGRYEHVMEEAKAAKAAKSEVDLKRLVGRSLPSADPNMILVTEADMKNFREQRLPFLRDLASGKISKEEFESSQLSLYRANYPLDEAWEAALGIVGLLCALAGIIGAAKLAFR